MTEVRSKEFLAECFWPGVNDADLHALDERIGAVVDGDGEAVRYLGSLFMREDEVVLCLFEGSEAAVRTTAERAEIPFERILETAYSPWPAALKRKGRT
jgi:Nickel responsive protein SCO4226-like